MFLDSSFTWANAGDAVFGIGSVSRRTENEANDDAEAPSSDDVHFEPIVHLPEVQALAIAWPFLFILYFPVAP